MRILFLALEPVARWGGSEELWAETAQAALEQGHEVWFTPRVEPYGAHETIAALIKLGGHLYERRSWLTEAETLTAEAVPSGVCELAAQLDVIFISIGGSVRGLLDGTVVDLIENSPVPVVVTIQLTQEFDLLPDEPRDLVRRVLNRVELLILPARRSLEAIERIVAARQSPAAIVPSPIRRDLKGPIPWPELERPTLACVARLNPAQKGQDLLLEVMAAPRWREREWTLNIVGRGLGEMYLNELISFYDLGDRVILTGFQEDMSRVWSRNHLLVMPSREESMPISIMEAMYCGRPCVVTDVGDNASLITDGVNGYVAAGDRPRALAAALEHAWSDRQSWAERGLHAHETFQGRRDPAPGRTALALLQEVCGSVSSRRR